MFILYNCYRGIFIIVIKNKIKLGYRSKFLSKGTAFSKTDESVVVDTFLRIWMDLRMSCHLAVNFETCIVTSFSIGRSLKNKERILIPNPDVFSFDCLSIYVTNMDPLPSRAHSLQLQQLCSRFCDWSPLGALAQIHRERKVGFSEEYTTH